MHIEQHQAEARRTSAAAVERFRAARMSFGTQLTPQNIAIGDWSNMAGFQWGRNAQSERELAHFKGWVYAAIRPQAMTIAGQPVRIATRRKSLNRPVPKRSYKASQLGHKFPHWMKSSPKDLDVYEDHPLMRVIERPNDQMTKFHLMFITVASLALTGRQHWWLTENKKTGRPVIWPIPTSWIQPQHTKERAFDHWLMMPGGTGEPIRLESDEVVYFYYPDPGNPLSVVPPLGACSRMAVADEAIVEAQYRSFRQGIWPGLAVVAGEYVDDDGGVGGRPLLEREQREQIYAAIRRHWGGVMNFNEPLILDALITDIKKISNTPAEMDFMNSSKMTKAAIQQTFGTNPSINGEIEGLNRATSISARYQFADFTINPMAQMLSETLTQTIGVAMSERGEELHIWIEPYQPDDTTEKRANFTALAQYSCVTVDEMRQGLGGLPAIGAEKGGDEMVKPGGMQQQQGQPTGIPGIPNFTGPNNGRGGDAAPPGIPSAVPTGDADAADAALDGNAIKRSKAKASAERVKEFRRFREWRKAVFIKSHEKSEKRLQALLSSIFRRQSAEVMRGIVDIGHRKLRGMRPSAIVDRVFNAKEWDGLLRAAVRPELHRSMVKGAATEQAAAEIRSKGLKAVGDEFPYIEMNIELRAKILDALEEIMEADFWEEVQASTKEALIATIAQGMERGESMYDLCARIGDDPTTEIGLENPGIIEPGMEFATNPVLGNGPSSARALLIARTETTLAYNKGHMATIEQLESDGSVVGKCWSAILDSRTRDAHWLATDEYSEANPIPNDQKFVLHGDDGDYACDCPGDITLPPALRCNCRCVVMAVFPDEYAAEQEAEEEYLAEEDQDGVPTQASVQSIVVKAVSKALASEPTVAGLLGVSKEWDEDKHPRGQPNNPGQFASGGGAGGGASSDSTSGSKPSSSNGKPSTGSGKEKPSTGSGKEKPSTSSKFDRERWSKMDMGKRREEWQKLDEDDRDKQADAINSIPARVSEHLKGVEERPNSGDIAKDIGTRVSQIGNRVHPQAAARLKKAGEFYASTLTSAGVNTKLQHELVMNAVDGVAAQEIEGMGRSLGDHGILHITGDISMAVEALDEAGRMTPKTKAIVTTAMLFHDIGYLAPPSEIFLDEGHQRWSQQYYSEHLRDTVSKALGSVAAGKVEKIIGSHDSTDMDWEGDPVTAACRLSDNLAVFHKEKLPPLFRYVPANVTALEKWAGGEWAGGEADFNAIKDEARTNVDKSNLPDPIKVRLRAAADELAERGGQDALGMLGGHVADIAWDQKANAPVVRLEENPINTQLHKLGDYGQRQFAKVAKTYGVDPKRFADDLNFEFRDKQGKVWLRGVWQKIKEWVEYIAKNCGG